jgi:hypothetical protein
MGVENRIGILMSASNPALLWRPPASRNVARGIAARATAANGSEHPCNAACYSCEASARSWYKASKRSNNFVSDSVTGQPKATNAVASSFRCTSASQLETP